MANDIHCLFKLHCSGKYYACIFKYTQPPIQWGSEALSPQQVENKLRTSTPPYATMAYTETTLLYETPLLFDVRSRILCVTEPVHYRDN